MKAGNQEAGAVNTLPFLSLALKLEDLLGWCEHPAVKPHAREWLDATKDDLRAAAQAAGKQSRHDRNLAGKVDRAERLSLKLAALLCSHPDIATQPVQQWPVKRHRDLFDALSDLERQFREIGETERAEPQRTPVEEMAADSDPVAELRKLLNKPEPQDVRHGLQQAKDYYDAIDRTQLTYLTLTQTLEQTDPESSEWERVVHHVRDGLGQLCQKLDWSLRRTILRRARRELERKGRCIPYQITVRDQTGTDIVDEGTAGETLASAVRHTFCEVLGLTKDPKPMRLSVLCIITAIDANSFRRCCRAAKLEVIEMQELLRDEYVAVAELERQRFMKSSVIRESAPAASETSEGADPKPVRPVTEAATTIADTGIQGTAKSVKDKAAEDVVSGWDEQTERRNKWLYDQCRKGTRYHAILAALRKKPKWSEITSVNGVKKAAAAYAEKYKLTPIPRRKRGRPKQN